MPFYTDRPPEENRPYALDLIRTPETRTLAGVATCSTIIGCPTHWYGGRTIPCGQTSCKPCSEGKGWLWHSYISLFTAGTNQHILVEFTSKTTETLIDWYDTNGTLRGCLLKATRQSKRKNGPVTLKVGMADLHGVTLPREPDIEKALALIWNLPEASPNIQQRFRNNDGQTVSAPRALNIGEIRRPANGKVA